MSAISEKCFDLNPWAVVGIVFYAMNVLWIYYCRLAIHLVWIGNNNLLFLGFQQAYEIFLNIRKTNLMDRDRSTDFGSNHYAFLAN